MYTGLRVAVLNIEIKKTDDAAGLGIRCDVANTGRQPLHIGKGKVNVPQNLVFEFDSVALPIILRGREALLREAVLQAGFNLAPGAMRQNISLIIPIKPADFQNNTNINNGNLCPDLVVDTIYLVKYTAKSILLHYIIRNKGQAPAALLGTPGHHNSNLNLRVYFVSGLKLTRGAIEAGSVQIRKGVETLDGVLLPGQVLQGEATISLKLRTRFSPNLLLEIDPFQSIQECDRTNNTRALEVAF
ncbi:MAG: hypothetical protein WCR52_09315 [Bacteroidota bacterium]